MMLRSGRWCVVLFLPLVLIARYSAGQGFPNKPFSGNLSQVLLDVVKEYRAPVIAELVSPIPSGLAVPQAAQTDKRAVLDYLLSQCPSYTWYVKDGVVIFAEKKVLRSPNDPMNTRLRGYQIPSTLSYFKVTFPNAVATSGRGFHGSGYVINGVGLPDSLSPGLKSREVTNITGRDILIQVASELREFYSVLILPPSYVVRGSLKNNAFFGWEIAGGPGLRDYHTNIWGVPKNPR